MKQKLDPFMKAAIGFVILVPLFLYCRIFFILPAYSLHNTQNTTKNLQAISSKVIALTVCAVVAALLFLICLGISLRRTSKNKQH
jgi:hypothetical protein